MLNLNRIITILSLCLLLCGCGFHLRGQGSNPLYKGLAGTSIYLAVAGDDKALYRQIKVDLQFSKFNVVDDADVTSYHLIVLQSKIKKRAIGVDINGRDNEYEISYQLDFIVNGNAKSALKNGNEDKNEQLEVESQRVVIYRNLYLDVNDPIGKRSEEKDLLDSIRLDLSRKLISHLVVAINNTNKASVGIQ